LLPEQKARKNIDRQLEQCGWTVQDYESLNLGESTGIAIREFPIGKDHADYILFIDRIAVGVIEAKPVGSTLSGVAEQSQSYLTDMLNLLSNIKVRPIFAYDTTGIDPNISLDNVYMNYISDLSFSN
jgi:type I restriction enzyme R subunit